MTYFQQLQETLNEDYHRVPFIYNPPELEMEEKVNGIEERSKLFHQSVDRHLSTIEPYKCRICDVQLPYHITVRHLSYSSSCNDDNPYELFLDSIYGCCESCVDKISKGELDDTINRVTYGDLDKTDIPDHIQDMMEELDDIEKKLYRGFIPYLD